MAQHDRYISPFSTRYASDEMQYIFSDDNKFRTWRKLWIALAKAEQKQGLAITDEQIAELEAHKDDVNYEDAIAREKLVCLYSDTALSFQSLCPHAAFYAFQFLFCLPLRKAAWLPHNIFYYLWQADSISVPHILTCRFHLPL